MGKMIVIFNIIIILVKIFNALPFDHQLFVMRGFSGMLVVDILHPIVNVLAKDSSF